ncbi:MAG: LamG domain-containing protein [Spirochaetaceae bacterium]
MNKRKLILYIVFINSISLFSQSKPIVQIDPMVNLSGESWLDSVCVSSTNGVSLIIRLLGRFEVFRDEPNKSEILDTTILKSRAETMGYDNILFGSCTIEDGSYIITMNAYDRALDKITYSSSTIVESIFDTFDAIDKITYQTVEGFSGIHVTYGALVLVPPRTGEPFSFTIDGVSLPKDVLSIDKMPSGIHKLTVLQERPFGLYEMVHNIVVEEKTINNIDVPLPLIAGKEVPIFNQVDQELRLAAIEGKSDIKPFMNDLDKLLGTPFFQKYRSNLVEKYERWESILDKEIIRDESDNRKIKYLDNSIWNLEKQKILFPQYPVSTNLFFLDSLNIDFHKGLALDGSGDYGEIKYSSELDLRSNITIESWIYINTIATNSDGSGVWGYTDSQPVISQSHGGSTAGNYTFGFSSDDLFFAFETIDSRYTGSFDFDEGEWYHIAVSHNYGDGSKTKLYVNGKEIQGRWVDDGSNPINGNGFPKPNSKGSYFVGSYNPEWHSIFFDGYIKELRIWNTTRSNTEINNSIRNKIIPITNGLILYYQFNQIQNSQIPDEINANNLNLFGNASISVLE